MINAEDPTRLEEDAINPIRNAFERVHLSGNDLAYTRNLSLGFTVS